MLAPCETSTSPCRSFATISSGLYLFLGISVLLDAKRHTSSRTTSMGVAHGQGVGTASLSDSVPALSRPEFTKYEGSIGFRGRSRMTPSDEGGASPGCLE